MTPADLTRLATLRDDLHAAIAAEFASGGCGKSYDGAIRLTMPPVPSVGPPVWLLEIDCYAIGPSRHYRWRGATLAEALDACERDVRGWIAEAAAEREAS